MQPFEELRGGSGFRREADDMMPLDARLRDRGMMERRVEERTMRREEQIIQARKLLGYLNERTTARAEGVYRNPVSDYTSSEQAARERELFFRRGAICVGLSCLLPNP